MENNWKNIWKKKDRVNSIILECLVKADGFDSVAGSLSVEDWEAYVGEFYNLIDLTEKDSVFEVGCGSGAFLFPHFLSGGVVGGIDYSSQLIDIAKGFMGSSRFSVCDAANLGESQVFDVVLSHSVFQYFSSLQMARNVVDCMIKKSNRVVAVLDVNDESCYDIYHEKRIKKFLDEGLSETHYWEKYKNLDHLFYPKSFFEEIGDRNGLKVNIFPQENINYGNSELRFNVIFKK